MTSEAHALNSDDARGLQQIIELLPMPVLVEGMQGGMWLCNGAARRQLAASGLDPESGAGVAELLREWAMRVSAGAPDRVQAQAWDAWRRAAADAPLVAAYLRGVPRVGVGLYTHPRTRWVHLDVRDRSYHWADATPPASAGGRRR